MASKFSNYNSQSYCASPSNKTGGGGRKGHFLLHGLEGVLDDLAQAEVQHDTIQYNTTQHNTHCEHTLSTHPVKRHTL